VRKSAEEPLATGVAAIGGDAKPAFKGLKSSFIDALAGNVIHVKVTATRTVGIAGK